MKNKYIKGTRISEKKFRKLLQLFCLDLDATQIAGVANINRNTVNRYLSEIRARIALTSKGIIDLETMKYERLNQVISGSERKSRGINGCDVFWGFAASRLQRFRGLQKSTLLLHIQESKFRYNHDRKELYPFLLSMFREQPLFQKEMS